MKAKMDEKFLFHLTVKQSKWDIYMAPYTESDTPLYY